MKDALVNKIMFLSSVFGGILLQMNINEGVNFIAKYISIVSFIVILVSNWYKFKKQIVYWYIKHKKDDTK